MNVTLFDYGAGNLHSLGKALEVAGRHVHPHGPGTGRGGAPRPGADPDPRTGAGITVSVTSDWAEALAADALVLPGVGAFGAAVETLPPDPAGIRQALEDGLPCLGICLGMQLLFEGSDEAEGGGIGLIPGRVRRLRGAVVPQMGWNDVEAVDDPLFRDVVPFVAYYANSFVCEPRGAHNRPDAGSTPTAVAWSEYGGERFVAGVRRGRTWGVQFHPEKSSDPGLRLLTNFLQEAAR